MEEDICNVSLIPSTLCIVDKGVIELDPYDGSIIPIHKSTTNMQPPEKILILLLRVPSLFGTRYYSHRRKRRRSTCPRQHSFALSSAISYRSSPCYSSRPTSYSHPPYLPTPPSRQSITSFTHIMVSTLICSGIYTKMN